MKTTRLIICAKDIMVIMGKSERTARRILAKIKAMNNKPVRSHISVEEFSRYAGVSVEVIEARMG